MKGTRFTKFISLLLSVMMVLTLLPSSALAEVTETPSEETPIVTNGDATEEGTGEDPVTKYTVRFYVGSDLVETQEVDEGSTAKRPSDPAVPAAEAAEGNIFLYWYAKNKNSKFYFDTPITEDLDLHALFGAAEEPAEEPEEEPIEEPAAKSAAPGTIIPDETFLKTYTFTVDGAQYGDTQTVATGDTLHEPAAPTAPAGMQFVGWFDSGNTQFTSFGTQTVEEDADITLHAEFAAAYYAFFYNAGGTAIIETRAPGTDNLVSTTDVTALQIAVDEALIGWSLTPGGSIVGSTVTVSGASVNLYPIIQKVKWISFNSNGGTYVSPMYVAPNTVLTSAMVNDYVDSQVEGTQIAKPGYTFNAWTGFTFGSAVTGDVTLNATWTAVPTTYTIVYLVENSDDTGYSYYSHTVVTATSGSTISSVAHPAITGCTYASQDLSSNNIVNGDGTTVVTVKYTRNIYQVLFYKITSSGWWGTSYAIDESKTINAKYGAYIGDQWPLDNGGNRLPYKVTQDGSIMQSGLEIMPLNGKSFWAINQTGNRTYKLYYYVETLNTTDPYDATYSGRYYKLHHVDSVKANSLQSTPDDHYDILGFTYTNNITYSGGYAQFDSHYEIKFFYNRNILTLQFYNYNAVDTAHTDTNVKYEADISGRYFVPSLPTGLPANYVFMGWFTTAACVAGSEYSFAGKTMPNQNVLLYAKWAPPSFTGIAHLTVYGTGGGTYNLGTIPYGGTISASALEEAQAEAELYKPHTTDTFGGWLIERNGSRTLFNASMQIYEDVVLYPQWISGISYNVTYDLNGATAGTAPTDATAYGEGAKAEVLAYDESSVTPPTGMVFVGWLGSDGHIYYPGSAITVTGDMTLTAQWSSSASAVTLTYNGNGGKRSDDSTAYDITAKNNSRHSVETNTFTNSGKNFVKWNTKADGSGTDYLEGASVLLSASQPSSPTTLYAIWEAVVYYTITVTVNPPEGILSYDGDGTYPANTNAHFIHWDVADGYYITSVYDNGVLVDPIEYSGNKLQIHKIDADHDIIINLAPTSYTLTYNGNGGTYSGGTTSASSLIIGEQYIVPANFFTNTGFYFLGWSTNSSATAADPAYAPGTTHDMPASDVTLYAVWAAKTNLVLTANSTALNYNGSAQSVSGFTGDVSGLTYGGTTTAGVTETNPGQYAATFTNTSGLIITQSGTDVTERYNVSFVPGTLTINPRVSYINGATGTEYAYEWVTYGTGDATYSITPDQNVTVGTVNYYWTGTWDIPAANDLIANTTITALYSQNKTLTITGDSDTVTYNGSEQEITTATLSDPTLVVTGYTVSGKGTNADDYDVITTLGTDFKIMSGTTDVTYQYDVSTVKGKLTILPATLTVTAIDKSITYPAARPLEATLDYTVAGEIGTEEAAFTGILGYISTLGTNPLPGSYTDVIVQGGLQLADNGAFKADNYAIDFVEGDLNVASGTFSVSLTDVSAVYSGSAHSATLNGTQSGDGIQYFVKIGSSWIPSATVPSVTNVSDGPKEIKVIVSRTGYNNAEATATLTITPATLTVTANDKTITYPANRPAEATLNYTVSGEVSGEDAAFTGLLAYQTGLAVQPAAGDYPEVIEQGDLALTDNGAFLASNYSLSFVKGDLTVLAGTFTPTSSGYLGTYDGNGHGLTADVPGVTGEIIWYSTSETGPFTTTPPTFTDAGTYTVYFMATDPAGNYDDSSVYSASVVITPATLKVLANTQSIVYPEERPEESALGYSLTSGNVSGETPAYSGILSYMSGLATNPTPGIYGDAIEQGTLTLIDNGSFLASNYTLSFTKGDLIVDKGFMFPESAGYTGVYDGVAHGLTAFVTEVPGAEITYCTSAGGVFTSEAPTFTDVGTYKVFFRASDPAGNYYPSSVVSADVVITPATLTVTANDKTITYPANRPAEATLNYTVSGEVSGEDAAFTGLLAYQTGLAVQPAAGDYPEVIEQGDLALTDNGAFLASNYSLSFVKGDLTVLTGTFTPTSSGYLGTYDGNGHGLTADVPGVTGEIIWYSTSETGPFTTTPPTFTDAGTYTVYFKATDPAGNYNDSSVQSGTVTINPATLTVTAVDKSITYPAARPAEASLDYTVAGEIGTEEAAFTGILGYVSTLGTNPLPGSYSEAIVQGGLQLADNDTFKASNYAIDFVEGDLDVANGTFSVSLTDTSAAYNGSAHFATLNGALASDDIQYFVHEGGVWLPISYTPSVTNVTDGPKEIKVLVSRTGYNNAEAFATLTITPVEVTVTAKDRSMTFGDTTTLTPAEGVTYAGFVNSETSSVVSGTGSITYAYKDGGTVVTVDNDLAVGSYTITPDVSGLAATNYTFKAQNGTLAVGIATMTVDSLGYSGAYDGNSHDLVAEASVSGMTITYSTSLGGSYTSTCPSYTDAGTYTVYFKAVDPDGNYADATGSAQIVIHKAEVTVTADNRSMTYGDTTTLTPAEGVTYTGFITGEDESLASGTGSITYTYKDGATVVAVNNSLDAGSYSIVPGVGGLSATNYTFTPANGTLTVGKATMEVASDGYDELYDGASHGLTASVDGKPGMTITYSDSATGTFTDTSPEYTDAGTYTVYFKAVDPDGNYADATGSAEINIRQVEVTVTADDQNMMYGDTTAPAETVSYSGFVNGENAASAGVTGDVLYSYYDSLMYMVAVSSTLDAGLYTITPDVGGLSATNYSFVPADGTLTVAKSDALDVSADDVEAPYDGFPYMVSPNVNDWNGTDVWYSLTDSTDPADYSMTPPSLVNVDDSARVYLMATNPNYENAFGSALVTITPVELTVTAGDQSMTYSSSAATPAASVSYSGFVAGEDENVVFGSAGYNYYSGTTEVFISSTLGAGIYDITPDVSGLFAENYTFAPVNGTLTVNKANMEVTSDGYDELYDGAAHGLEAEVTGLTGMTITYSDSATGTFTSASPEYTDAGTYTVYFKAVDPAGNYSDATGSADIVIRKVEVTVTADDRGMTYGDTTTLTPAEGVTYTGFIAGEDESLVSGTVGYGYFDGATAVTISNTLPAKAYDITPDVSGLSATNYTFVPADGTLTVGQATMEVTSDGYDELYDGNPHGLTASVDGKPGMTITYSDSAIGTFTDTSPEYAKAGTYTVYFKAVDPDGNYADATGSAEIIIHKVEVTVTADNRSMTYGDTTTLTPAEGVTYSGFITGEDESLASGTGSINYTYKDGATVVAVNNTLGAGSYSIVPGVGGLSATNYTFVPVNGTLTVEKADMTPTSTGYSDTYDGAPHGLTASVAEVPGAAITYSDSATGTFTSASPEYANAGTYEVFFKAVDPDGNYNDSDVYSAFVVINKRYISIITNSANKAYDATPLTDEGWEYGLFNEGFADSEGFLTSGATGTLTNAGSINNPFAYTLNGSTLLDNYTFAVTEGTLAVYPRSVVVILDAADKNYGDTDPAFTYHYLTVPGLYDILPGTGVTLNLIRTDAGLPTGEDVGYHAGVLNISVDYATPEAASNYIIVSGPGDFTIHPQVTYNVNTLDAVTGFPATEWFDYLTDATFADATGVARLGFVLVGWEDALTGNPIALGETITGIDRNYSLNAVWELMTYSIFYVPNTAMAVTNMPGTQTDVPYTSIATMSNLVPTRAGFTFVHWDTADIPGSISLDPGSAFPMPNNDVTFVAIWEPDLNPVYYHANGGQGGTIEDGPFATLTTVTVAGNGFTRTGYRFIGWSTTPNGGVSAQPGNTFMMPVEPMDYYAQWEQELYTVTYVVNGGTTAGLDGAVPYAEYTDLAYGDAMPVPADPAQDGYNFDGWTTAIPATVPEGGLTIYGSMTAVTEPEIIPDEPTPLAGASWALLNLILAIATALGSVLMLIGLAGKKRKEEFEGVVVRETKKHPVTRLMTLLPAIGGIVAFILTENMKNPMAFVDRWTILMAVIAVLQIALVLLGVKKDKDVDPDSAK